MPTTTTGVATEFINFSRASNATVTDSNGVIKWARHNLLLASEQFDAASWTKTNVTVAANAVAAPNGTTTADQLLETTTNAGHLQGQSVATSAGRHVFAVYAKPSGRDFVGLYNGDLTVGKIFDVANGTVGSDITAAPVSASITAVGGGWYRCEIVVDATAATTNWRIYVCNSSSTFSYAGDITKGLYLWGAHLYRSDLGGMQANTSAYPMYNPTTPKNLLGFTENFDNANWAQTSISVLANVATAPNGLTTADKIYPTANDGSLAVTATSTIALKTFSIYAKAAEFGVLCFREPGNAVNGLAYVNLSSGAVTNSIPATATVTATSVGDGWWRVGVFYASGAAGSVVRFGPSNTAGAISSTASGTNGILVWGAQLSDSASLDPYVANHFAAPSAAAYYGPRLDYDPVTLAAKGLLVEEQRSNLCTNSDNFGTGWNVNRGAVTINDTASPDGTVNADKLVTTTANAGGTWLGKSTGITTTSGSFSFSVFLKKGTSNGWSVLSVGDGTNYYSVWYNLNTGAVGSNTSAGTDFTAKSQNIVPYGNGWYRCWLTITRTTTTQFEAYVYTDCNANLSYQSTLNNFDYLYGAQVEAGTFPTSYIPTTSATVTRNGDVAQVGTAAFPYSATEGTLVVAWQLAQLSGSPAAIHLTDVAESNRIRINAHLAGINRSTITAAGALVDNIDTSTAATGITKYAIGGKSSDYAVYRNGSAGGTSTNAGFPSGCTEMRIGRDAATGNFNGHIRQITYIPRRLANAELQTRTA